jgi:hypothetical protein
MIPHYSYEFLQMHAGSVINTVKKNGFTLFEHNFAIDGEEGGPTRIIAIPYMEQFSGCNSHLPLAGFGSQTFYNVRYHACILLKKYIASKGYNRFYSGLLNGVPEIYVCASSIIES